MRISDWSSDVCSSDLPAPLPRLRGRGVIPWTILANEPITAGTLFWIDDGADSGPILEQAFFHVAPDETAASLYARHMRALGEMMPRALAARSEEHTSETPVTNAHLVCRLLLVKKKTKKDKRNTR